jgi:uncharacterized OsmC-like protein
MAIKETNLVNNGIDMELLGNTVNAIKENPELGRCKFRVKNRWLNGGHNTSKIEEFFACGQETAHKQPFDLYADEPPALGGTDEGANPVEHLLNALAACVTTTIVAHAAVRGIEIEHLESQIEGDIDLRGFLGLDEKVPKGFQNIRVRFKVKTDPKNIDKLNELARFSPVYNTLSQGTNVEIGIEKA